MHSLQDIPSYGPGPDSARYFDNRPAGISPLDDMPGNACYDQLLVAAPVISLSLLYIQTAPSSLIYSCQDNQSENNNKQKTRESWSVPYRASSCSTAPSSSSMRTPMGMPSRKAWVTTQ